MSQAALVSLKGNKGVGGGGINGVGEGASMRSWSAGLSRGGGKKEGDAIPLRREIIGQSVQRNPAWKKRNVPETTGAPPLPPRGPEQRSPLKGSLKAPLFTAPPVSRGLEPRRLKDAVFLLAALIIYRYDDRNAVIRPARSFLQSEEAWTNRSSFSLIKHPTPKKLPPKKLLQEC